MGISSWFSGLAVSSIAETARGVADVVDKFKAAFQTVMARMAQEPGLAQVEINKIGAAHRSLFIAGWRPAVGYICALGLAFVFLVNPIVQWLTGDPGPAMPTDIMLELVIGMLGLSGLRTVEKLTGRAK